MTHIRILILQILPLLSAVNSFAQGPVFDWVGQVTGEQLVESYSVTVDDDGNVITLGYFEGIVDVDPGPAEVLLSTTNPLSLDVDIFIQKLDSMGNLVWAKSFGGPLADGAITPPFPSGTHFPTEGVVDVDENGDIYVVAAFKSDSIDLNPDGGGYYIYNHNPSNGGIGTFDYLTLKLAPNGTFLWGHAFGGDDGLYEDHITSATVDSNGNLIIVGTFVDSVDFDPSPTEQEILVADTLKAGFIQKLSSDGELLWAMMIGDSSGSTTPYDVKVDDEGNIHVVGFFSGTVDFDLGPDVSELEHVLDTAALCVFLLKLHANGDLMWVKQLPEGGGNRLAIGSDGTIALSASMLYVETEDVTIDINPSLTEQYLITVDSGAYSAHYYVRLTENGDFLSGGWINARLEGLQIDSENGLLLVGHFSDTIDADPSLGEFLVIMAPEYATGIAVIRLDAAGFFDWARTIGPGIAVSRRAMGFDLDASNRIYLTAGFAGTVDFDPSEVAQFNMIAGGLYVRDAFILKWSQPNLITASANVINDLSFVLYPNPASDHFSVNMGRSYQNVEYRIVDAVGRTVQTGSLSNTEYINVSIDCLPGIYLFVLETGQGSLTSPLIIH